MSIDEAEHIKNGGKSDHEENNILDIANYLKLPPVKLHCSLLAEDAIKKALHNFKTKNETLYDSTKENKQ